MTDHPIIGSPDHRISPLESWSAIRSVLERELGDDERDIWIRHARLHRVLAEHTSAALLLIAMPRNGRVLFGGLRHKKRMQRLAQRLGYALSIVPQIQDYQIEQIRDERGNDAASSWQTYLEPAPSELWSDWSQSKRKVCL